MKSVLKSKSRLLFGAAAVSTVDDAAPQRRSDAGPEAVSASVHEAERLRRWRGERGPRAEAARGQAVRARGTRKRYLADWHGMVPKNHGALG